MIRSLALPALVYSGMAPRTGLEPVSVDRQSTRIPDAQRGIEVSSGSIEHGDMTRTNMPEKLKRVKAGDNRSGAALAMARQPVRAVKGSVMARVLTILIRRNAYVEFSEFRSTLGVSAKALSVTLNRLVKKGLVYREARGFYALARKKEKEPGPEYIGTLMKLPYEEE